MAYSPNNILMYIAVYSGALAGMGVSNRVPTDTNPASYAGLASLAGAFAQEFDTVWGSRTTSLADISSAEEMAESTWQGRSPQPVAPFTNPTTYLEEVTALIAILTAQDDYLAAQGIVPPPPGGIAPSGTGLVTVTAGVLDTSALAQVNVGNILKGGLGGQFVSLVPAKYGSGNDGDVIFSGSVLLARTMNYRNVTFVAGAAVNTQQFPIYATGTFDITNIPSGGLVCIAQTMTNLTTASNNINGNNANVNVAGQAKQVSAGDGINAITAPAAGAVGATNAGIIGGGNFVLATAIGGNPGPPSTAGNGATGAGAIGGALQDFSLSTYPQHGEIAGINGGKSSTGGGSGGGDGTASASGAGGGGGTGGGAVVIFARRFVRSSANPNTSCIVAKGGNGGNGGTPSGGNRGGGAAAAGAGGGVFRLVCEELAGSEHVGCVDVSGGNGGTGGTGTGTGTNGQGGYAGFGGRSLRWCQSTSPLLVATDLTAVGGNAPVGTVGGIATPALANL